MSQKSDKVKSGYAELDTIEREEVRKFIEEFEKLDYEAKQDKVKLFCRVLNKSVGPKDSSTCPCCHK